MVGIQVGNEQEERKGEEKRMIREKFRDFIVPSNAGDDFSGSDMDDDVRYVAAARRRGERGEDDIIAHSSPHGTLSPCPV